MKLRFSRRRFLSSTTLAAVSAMPFVHQLVPSAHAAGRAQFLFVMYSPFGVLHREWFPAGFGRNFTFKASSAPLSQIKDDVLIFSNLDNAMGEKNECKNGLDQHQAGVSSIFAGATMNPGRFGSGPGGPTIDSQIAKFLEPKRHHDQVVTNLGVRSTEHGDHWIRYLLRKTDGAIVNSEDNPLAAFSALFGAGGTSKPLPTAKPFTGLKDALREDLMMFERALAQPEREKFQSYMESFAAFERSLEELPQPMAPSCEVPTAAGFGKLPNDHRHSDIWPIAQMQIRLGVLALSCGARRVATLHLTDGFRGYRVPAGPYPDTGVFDGHGLSHHTITGNPERLRANLNFRQAQLFVELVDKLKQAANPLTGGSLFDASVVLWSSCISGEGGGGHSKLRVPFTLAAGKQTGIITGRHVDAGFGTNSMLLRSVTHAFGMPDQSFGDPEFCRAPLGGVFEDSAKAGSYERNVMQYKNLTGRCQGHAA